LTHCRISFNKIKFIETLLADKFWEADKATKADKVPEADMVLKANKVPEETLKSQHIVNVSFALQ